MERDFHVLWAEVEALEGMTWLPTAPGCPVQRMPPSYLSWVWVGTELT